MASLTVKGRQVGYQMWHAEQDKMLVLFHGFTGSGKGWASIAEQFPEYRVIAFDMIGKVKVMHHKRRRFMKWACS